MLTELHIENLGVISALTLRLGPGMTVLTGETGAGKTMLVEAIELLVGGRAESTLVRPGALEARVEGRFVVDDDEVVLARVIPAEGRSRAYINGRLATVGLLAEEGVRLVDLHGQHAHQSLLAAAAQRDALDRFAGVDLGPLRIARQRVATIDSALGELGGDGRARARELDLLQFQANELEKAAITSADEDDALEVLEDSLADAQAHKDAAARAEGAPSVAFGSAYRVTWEWLQVKAAGKLRCRFTRAAGDWVIDAWRSGIRLPNDQPNKTNHRMIMIRTEKPAMMASVLRDILARTPSSTVSSSSRMASSISS